MLLVAQGEQRLLVGTPLDAGEEIGEFDASGQRGCPYDPVIVREVRGIWSVSRMP